VAFSIEEGLPHVPSQQANFGMAVSPILQLGDMWFDHQTIEPFGREAKLSIRA